MTQLSQKKILVAVSGGIAAYKAAQLVRDLQRAGATVRVAMTEGATRFVAPLTFQALTGNPVATQILDPSEEHEIGHIELARWPDLIVVAPATANVLAKAAVGLADDLVTTTLLASEAPVLFCPAMNTQMLRHPATQQNIAALRARERTFLVEPDAGELACGEVGAGRLPDPPVIVDAAAAVLSPALLAGRHVLVSAGPTREHFDPARFISNPSSGRMGYAIAAAATALGADVTLVSGPVSLEPPTGVECVPVVSAADMQREVNARSSDIVVMAAAVADWTPTTTAEHKRKKGGGDWSPELQRTPDIIAGLAASPKRPVLVIGFAAETEHVVEYAREKMKRKGLDGIVANDVGGTDTAFGNATNAVTLLAPGQDDVVLPRAPKRAIADRICGWLTTLQGSNGNS